MARAFQADPAWAWVVPDESRRRRVLPWLFAAGLRLEVLRKTALSAEDGAGVATWIPPSTPRPTRGQVVRAGLPLAELLLRRPERIRLRRYFDVSQTLYRHDLAGAWYLSGVAVDPALQRHGIGRALVEWGIERARGDGRPCGLLTYAPENLSFYEPLGFSVVSLHDDPGGVPRAWAMLRQ